MKEVMETIKDSDDPRYKPFLSQRKKAYDMLKQSYDKFLEYYQSNNETSDGEDVLLEQWLQKIETLIDGLEGYTGEYCDFPMQIFLPGDEERPVENEDWV